MPLIFEAQARYKDPLYLAGSSCMEDWLMQFSKEDIPLAVSLLRFGNLHPIRIHLGWAYFPEEKENTSVRGSCITSPLSFP